MINDLQCNHCLKWFEVCNDDGAGYDETRTHDQECPHCDETVFFTNALSNTYYNANKEGNRIDVE